MEWVETTGKTVEEALEVALDKLGVAQDDAEFEVLEEPKTGLFGRVRGEARVRARVQPTTPRPKDERRGRSRKPASREPDVATAEPAAKAANATKPAKATKATKAAAKPSDGADDDGAKPRRNPTKKAAAPVAAAKHNGDAGKDHDMSDTDEMVPLAEQGAVASAFVQGIVERFGAPEAQVTTHELDSETLEVRVEGGDLGLLIGPKGVALQSLQELTRTVVQRQTGARSGRILVDVSGYRAKRKEALERFAQKVADDVLASGSAVTLEPMNPSDRKVIHDAINTIDGVSTSSSGEEPRRRVVVSPG